MIQIVGHDPIRAMCVRYPEEFDFEVVGELVNLDGLAAKNVLWAPSQILGQTVGPLASGIIDQTVGLDRADEGQLQGINEDHHVLGRVPSVHEHRLGGQSLLGQGPCKHLAHMVKLAFSVPLGVVQAVVDDPVLAAIGIDIQAIDHSNSLDQSMGVSTVLQAHQIDMMRMILVDNGVIEDQAAIGRSNQISLDVFPDQARRQFIAAQHAVDRNMTESVAVFCEMRHGEIGVTGTKELTII